MDIQTKLHTHAGNLTIPFRSQAVQALAVFREEWQKLAEKDSLLVVQAPVGLILTDIADKLGLSPQERHIFLGDALAQEVNQFMQEQIKFAQ